MVPDFMYDVKESYFNMLVPTVDTARCSFLYLLCTYYVLAMYLLQVRCSFLLELRTLTLTLALTLTLTLTPTPTPTPTLTLTLTRCAALFC